MAPKAVQFGAGNIGRGFIAQLFRESGYDVVFIDVVEEVVRLLNERGSYNIEIVGPGAETVPITGVRAVNGRDLEAVAREIESADIVCTAVGVNVLKHVAAPIAAGIKLRADADNAAPLNIIICENLINASKILRGYILDAIPAEYADYVGKNVGLVESVVSRMVPFMTEEQRKIDPLTVKVEAYKKLPVDKRGFVGEIPKIVGFMPYDNFGAYVERKLFTHNLGHAAASYLGYRHGFEYVYEAVSEPDIRRLVKAALAETGEALIKKHGFTPEEHEEHIEDLLTRFANVSLGDTIARCAFDPVRKLGPNDRIIGGARLAMEYGIEPENVALAAAAAVLYDHPDDPAAMRIQGMLAEKGLDFVLKEICGLEADSKLAEMIRGKVEMLKQ